MTAKQKVVQKRVTWLQLAEKLGNVSKACRLLQKVSGSRFYEYKRAFRQYGMDGLVDKPPIPLSHPGQLSRTVKKRVARPEGFEPPAYGFEVRRSIQLSYGRIGLGSSLFV